jgi:C4-dicarboxylate transporter DctQ subunit
MREKIKWLFLRMRDCVEVLIPVITFSVLFLAFVYSVFSRYVLNRPPAWGTEVQVATYIWTVLLGACYVRRLNKHVNFTMVYDLLSEDGQRGLRIFRNLVMGITYAILLKPTVRYIMKYRTVSPSLKIPVKFYFFPIIILTFGVMCYSFADVYRDVRKWLMKRQKR